MFAPLSVTTQTTLSAMPHSLETSSSLRAKLSDVCDLGTEKVLRTREIISAFLTSDPPLKEAVLGVRIPIDYGCVGLQDALVKKYNL
jgi:hypothetical protein